MFQIVMFNGELNDTYYGTIQHAPADLLDLPEFLKQHPFIVLIDASNQKIVLNSSNIIVVAETTYHPR